MPDIHCADLGFQRCPVVILAPTNDHAIAQISDHLAWAHGITPAWFTPTHRERLHALLGGAPDRSAMETSGRAGSGRVVRQDP